MVPNNLIISLFILYCIDCGSAAFVGQTLVPYNKTGKHFVLIKAHTTSSEAHRPILPKIALTDV